MENVHKGFEKIQLWWVCKNFIQNIGLKEHITATHSNFSWETRNQGILWQEISHKKNRQEKQEIDEGKKGT